MFTSSIALDIDTKRLKEDLNCDLKIIPTYYVEHHPDSKDPDAYLQCMVNQHLAGKTCYDFAILAIGTNDITDLDTVNAPPTTLTNNVADQTKTIVEVAETLAAENNLDVFIVDKPPRYDPPTSDPTGMYAKLSKYSNGVLASSVGMTPRLFIVDQSSLGRSGVKARSDIYRPDGLHLTSKGISFYTSNITKCLLECYADMAIPKQQTTRQHSSSHVHDQGYGRVRHSDFTSGGGGGQDRRRDRPPQDRPGYGYPGGQSPYSPYPAYPQPPPPGWGSGGWGGKQKQRRQRQDQNWDYSSNAGYSGGFRGDRRY